MLIDQFLSKLGGIFAGAGQAQGAASTPDSGNSGSGTTQSQAQPSLVRRVVQDILTNGLGGIPPTNKQTIPPAQAQPQPQSTVFQGASPVVRGVAPTPNVSLPGVQPPQGKDLYSWLKSEFPWEVQ